MQVLLQVLHATVRPEIQQSILLHTLIRKHLYKPQVAIVEIAPQQPLKGLVGLPKHFVRGRTIIERGVCFDKGETTFKVTEADFGKGEELFGGCHWFRARARLCSGSWS